VDDIWTRDTRNNRQDANLKILNVTGCFKICVFGIIKPRKGSEYSERVESSYTNIGRVRMT
jgi:hypothetical protein